jgi:ribosomal protein S18 acetylase RimI-like enzyme
MKKSRKLIEQANNLSSSDLHHILQTSNFDLSNYQIEIFHAVQLSNDYQKQIIDLFESNMKTLYEQSKDGYKRNEKEKELFSHQSRYLIILSANSIIAFAHFRFDVDYGNRVLYLYELQVNMKYQGQGLGKWMIEQLKIFCQKTQMTKIVLTVQKMNTKAIDFYMKKFLFQIDFTNPKDENVDYLILSFTV